MIINQLDLGQSHPWPNPSLLQVMGQELVTGYETTVWPLGSDVRQQRVTFWLQEWQGIGGAAAKSLAATQYLLKQVEELATNRDQQPVYIQWNATAQGGAPLNATELHDGWYVINEFRPNYQRYVVSGIVECSMTVTHVADAPPRRVAMAYSGGALSSNFSGTANNVLELPYGSTALEASFNRVHATGIQPPSVQSPVASPEPFVGPTSIANFFKGAVEVYDTINTGSNPVPTSGGTYVNANWVQVFDTHHDFQGDCVVTNGLLLLLIAISNPTISVYLWNTALAASNWQLTGAIGHYDNAGDQSGLIKSYSLTRVGMEECGLTLLIDTATPRVAQFGLRLQRGRYECRLDFKAITEANAQNAAIIFTPNVTPKILYNSGAVADHNPNDGNLAVQTDYGFGCNFVANPAQPYICGLLWQNQPSASQPLHGFSGYLGSGDGSGPALNAQRSYGFFAIPYGVSGSYSTANLQAEGESGTLGTGWSSVADAAASGGNTAKAASGTLANNNDTFGTAFVPLPATYDVWFRVRVTSAAGSASEMQLGLWDSTSSGFVASTTFKANQSGTSYGWLRACTAVTPTASHNMRFQANTAATLGTDWFIDEAVMVPKVGGLGIANMPQDIFQQFMYDRSVRLVRQ